MTIGSLSLFITALALILTMSPAIHAHVSGGGPRKTDCYVEFEGVEATAGIRVECIDGDPTCDHDGECGAGCTFLVQVCAFRQNPELPECTPQEITTFPVNSAALALPAAPVVSETCGVETPVTVPLRRAGRRAGKRLVKVTALSTGTPRKDKDRMLLRCLPRPECIPSTTTTTTTTGSSTTRFSTSSVTGTSTTGSSSTGVSTSSITGTTSTTLDD